MIQAEKYLESKKFKAFGIQVVPVENSKIACKITEKETKLESKENHLRGLDEFSEMTEIRFVQKYIKELKSEIETLMKS